MSTIYITGHKNPDFDSICSAYAYAVLKNTIDSFNTYIAVRCGHLSDNTKKVFATLGITPPPYMRDIYPKVKDVILTSEGHIDLKEPLNSVAKSYKDTNPSVIPVFDGDKFFGLLSVDDITGWAMGEIAVKGSIDKIPTVGDIMREQEDPVDSEEMFEEAKKRLSSSKKRGLAVFENGEYIGFVTRRCFLRAPRNNVILVDHNESKQSIRGIETANIAEIIDHHRLDAVKTELPIYIDAEPLGSTCTIVYRKFMAEGIEPDLNTAKMLLAGIVADTLILRSPTTTKVDIAAAKDLSKFCGMELEEFGLTMFGSMEGLKNRNPEEAVSSDFKTYKERNVKIGIGQCEVTTLEDLPDYKEIYLNALDRVRMQNGLDWAVLMITDVMKEHSILLSTDHSAEKNLQYTKLEDRVYDMPGVMSRKKQLLPEVLHATTV
ncbi:MAG: DHH family phosphoesterase [Lachnospiraceae bacterium]|nr:DHH family phosphoesterase [Lachnospiraceae bacterium]